MSYTLTQVIFAVSRQGVALSADTAGYLVLAVAEQASDGRAVGDDHVTLESSGGLTVSRGASDQGTTTQTLLGNRLGRLLSAASGENLRLVAAAREPASDIGGFVGQLREALLPLNRSAAQRALKRLYRHIDALGEDVLSQAPSLPEPDFQVGVDEVEQATAGFELGPSPAVARPTTRAHASPVVAHQVAAVEATTEHTVRVLLQTPIVEASLVATWSTAEALDIECDVSDSFAQVEPIVTERVPILLIDPDEGAACESAPDETRRLGSLAVERLARPLSAPSRRSERVAGEATPRLWSAVQTTGQLPSLIEVALDEQRAVAFSEDSREPDLGGDSANHHTSWLISLEDSLPVPEVEELPAWLVDEVTISDAVPVEVEVVARELAQPPSGAVPVEVEVVAHELAGVPSDVVEHSAPTSLADSALTPLASESAAIGVPADGDGGAAKLPPARVELARPSRDAGLGTIRGRRSDVRELVSAFTVQPVQTQEQLLSALRRTVDAQSTPFPPKAKAAGAD